MTTAFYRNGTVAVTQNSKVVTGTNTNWATGATKPLAGDVFVFNNKIYEIENVISNTEIRLYRNFEDANASNQAYMIMRNASLNISSRIAAQVAQVVNQKQIMLDEFENFLTNTKNSTVHFTDTLGNKVPVTPIPMLDAAHNQAIADLNQKADDVIRSQILMSEGQARALQAQNEEFYVASGMVHNGKHVNDANKVNEGLYIHTTNAYAHQVYIGRDITSVGTSKTDFAVTHIAGAVINILMRNGDNRTAYELGAFSVPDAEAGTRVYDSTGDARGSGKATLDFRFDQDPKYGDVPTGTEEQVIREAAKRAFGYQRWNVDEMEVTGASNIDFTTKVLSLPTGGQGVTLLKVPSNIDKIILNVRTLSNVGQILEARDSRGSGTGPLLSSVALKVGENVIDLNKLGVTRNYDYVYLRRPTGSFNVTITFDSIYATKSTEEVVTHRTDLLAWEYFEEELTGRQEIMECVGSMATTFGDTGIPTVLSTRPLSYFQQYEGQFDNPSAQNDRYRCVVWPDLTDQQKRLVASYMGPRLFEGVNGKPVNGRLRPRTFRGGKNGDWDFYNPWISATSNYLYSSPVHRPQVQGASDTVEEYVGNIAGLTYGNGVVSGLSTSIYNEKSLYTARSATSRAYQGRCFLYVVATIPRANQGAYHLSFNPWGTANIETLAGTGSHAWYAAPDKVKSRLECFTRARKSTGSIGSVSGHPAGILHNAIRPSGLNGLIDWRKPAAIDYGEPEEISKIQSKAEDGTYRGLEKLTSTKVFSGLVDVFTANQFTSRRLSMIAGDITQAAKEWVGENRGRDVADDKGKLPVMGYLVNDNTKDVYPIHNINITSAGNEFRFNTTLDGYNSAYANDGVSWSLVLYSEIQSNLSVSGGFQNSTIVGDPVELAKSDDLKYGFLGIWSPIIPDGTTRIPLVRKRTDAASQVRYINSTNHGITWSPNDVAFDSVNNDKSGSVVGLIAVMPFKANAKVTKPTSNKKVLNGKAGVMPVFVASHSDVFRGNTLQESLTGKIGTNNISANLGKHTQTLSIEDIYFDTSVGRISGAKFGKPKHEPLTLTAPNNDSPAVKMLPYQIADNELASIGYQANELIYKRFSDGGTVTINVSQPFVAGNRYRIVNPYGPDLMFLCTNSLTTQFAALRQQPDGTMIGNSSSTVYGYVVGILETGSWGDDGEIQVTATDSDVFIDRNGNANLSVSHELAIAPGWTRNNARAGAQVIGIDL